MPQINALSLTPAIKDWLANTRHPRILHVFDNACNMLNEQKEILSIVTSQVGDGPFNLVINDDVLLSEQISLESLVSVSPAELTIGDITIHTADAKLWNPRPNWEMLHTKMDDVLNRILSLRANDNERSNPFTDLEIAASQPALLATTSISNPLISNLSIAIANADIPLALTQTSKLAGLGIGLTPSGDDFIMGALYAAWIIHLQGTASLLAKEIANTAAPLTTSLSAAWLRSAGRGEAGILWHEFFDVLVRGESVELPITKLLSVGETSGADALTGFLGVMSAFKERIPGSVTNCAWVQFVTVGII